MKILAVASNGGHWVELIRITKSMEREFKLCYIGTNAHQSLSVEGNVFYKISDFSRADCYKLIFVSFQAVRILIKENPDAIITTGAAPGAIFLLIATLFRKKTIWIDSIANVRRLSLSGRIVSLFASRIYTQWKELESKKVIFVGNVFNRSF